MTTAILNGKLIFPDRIEEQGWLTVEDGVITGTGTALFKGMADVLFDADGKYVSPGFVDIHTHGAAGSDFMDGTAEAFINSALAHLKHGTTTIVPTTLTCSNEELEHVFDCYHGAKKLLAGKGPTMPGMHLEGPFFSRSQAGAQDPQYLQLPTPENVSRILRHAEDILRISAAVELPGAMALGDSLKEAGILAAIGHSDAEFEQVMEAVHHGYTHITHLYSGMSLLHRIGPYRHLGVVEAGYLLDELSVEIIADGKHLPPELLRLIVKCKPVDQICLITDSMRGACLPDGSVVKLGSLEKGQDVILEDSVAMLLDRTAFAGSVCTTDRCVRSMYRLAGVPLIDAVKMMTGNPARVMGLSKKGVLAKGMDADICVFDDNITVSDVFVMGKKLV